MDAFVAYRSQQLQAHRSHLVDLSSTGSLPDTIRGEIADKEPSPEIMADLKLVSTPCKLNYIYTVCECDVLMS